MRLELSVDTLVLSAGSLIFLSFKTKDHRRGCALTVCIHFSGKLIFNHESLLTRRIENVNIFLFFGKALFRGNFSSVNNYENEKNDKFYRNLRSDVRIIVASKAKKKRGVDLSITLTMHFPSRKS